MTWRALALRYAPPPSAGDPEPCRCAHNVHPHPPTYEAEWLLVETGEVARRNVCRARGGQIAAEFDLHPMPFGPGITEARPRATVSRSS